MSVKYLMLATKTVEVEDNCQTSRIWEHKTTLLDNSGLDINSCLQFLLDYYTQLLKNQVNYLLGFSSFVSFGGFSRQHRYDFSMKS
jgi:hypothetical protein